MSDKFFQNNALFSRKVRKPAPYFWKAPTKNDWREPTKSDSPSGFFESVLVNRTKPKLHAVMIGPFRACWTDLFSPALFKNWCSPTWNFFRSFSFVCSLLDFEYFRVFIWENEVLIVCWTWNIFAISLQKTTVLVIFLTEIGKIFKVQQNIGA